LQEVLVQTIDLENL